MRRRIGMVMVSFARGRFYGGETKIVCVCQVMVLIEDLLCLPLFLTFLERLSRKMM